MTSPRVGGAEPIGPRLEELAKSCGLGRRRLAAIEDGRAEPTDGELDDLAPALGVGRDTFATLNHDLTVRGATGADGSVEKLRGRAASDALLREYLEMVRELRGTRETPPESLREDDLTELAGALGGTAPAIEARLKELLATDDADAHTLRTMIVPSLGREPSNA
jgi:transcriptional regulator with XRE-family HTH domain